MEHIFNYFCYIYFNQNVLTREMELPVFVVTCVVLFNLENFLIDYSFQVIKMFLNQVPQSRARMHVIAQLVQKLKIDFF